MSIEQDVKSRFSAWFSQEDWKRFKAVSELYYQRAVYLVIDDINFPFSISTSSKDSRLLARNIQKRLDIGIATELLIKSYYLKNGYMINLVKEKNKNMKHFPFLQTEDKEKFQINNTFTLNDLIENLHKTKKFKEIKVIKNGFRVAKVFRNKEGHVVTKSHLYESTDYDKIENALIAFYKEAFSEELSIRFSFEHGEEGRWCLRKI